MGAVAGAEVASAIVTLVLFDAIEVSMFVADCCFLSELVALSSAFSAPPFFISYGVL